MADLMTGSYLRAAVIVVLGALSITAQASIKYVFNVTTEPASDFHKPLTAELILTDSAVFPGEAKNAEIESIRIAAGTVIKESLYHC